MRRPTPQAALPSADHAAEIARLQRENERLRMEREHFKMQALASARRVFDVHWQTTMG